MADGHDPFATLPLNALRAIERVARTGSLRAAAETLGVTQGAVSQQIRRAELRLGKALFHRRPAGLVPTSVLAEILPDLELGFTRLASAAENLRTQPSQRLNISVAPVFAARFLTPRLSAFKQAHPQIDISLVVDGQIADLSQADLDVGIRYGKGNWPRTKSKKVCESSLVLVCSPELARKLQQSADLSAVTVIRDISTSSGWRRWAVTANLGHDFPLTFSDMFGNPSVAIEAALASAGVLLAVDLLVADLLASGALVDPFKVRAASDEHYWLVNAEGRSQSTALRTFARWLQLEAKLCLEGLPANVA
ncbi:LysR substrate-binding domain-containing protein [Pararhizobium arenae]|uniref:LysR substrate-binding domain-containing protein n=1 Tax=Pararhizobium arenae TaxID=1856850 RepID=UPI00094AB596|nr:LysR substrate-binding domain-containing protein [Pararhizobium arenae]